MTDDEKLDAKRPHVLLDEALELTMSQRGIDLSPTDAAALVGNFLTKLANAVPPHPIDMDCRALAMVLRANVKDE